MEIFIVRHSTHLHTKEDSCRNKVELLIHLVIILSKQLRQMSLHVNLHCLQQHLPIKWISHRLDFKEPPGYWSSRSSREPGLCSCVLTWKRPLFLHDFYKNPIRHYFAVARNGAILLLLILLLLLHVHLHLQRDQIWRNFATLAKKLQIFGKFLIVHFLFGKLLSILWQICDIMGLVFFVSNGQILTYNLTIWSHCPSPSPSPSRPSPYASPPTLNKTWKTLWKALGLSASLIVVVVVVVVVVLCLLPVVLSNKKCSRKNVLHFTIPPPPTVSVTWWLDYISIFGHLQHWKLAQ